MSKKKWDKNSFLQQSQFRKFRNQISYNRNSRLLGTLWCFKSREQCARSFIGLEIVSF